MRSIISLILLLATTLGWAGEAPRTTPPMGIRSKDPGYRAFTHATLVVAPGNTLEDATLVVRDGRVAAVGANIDVPEGATEVDLEGKTIFPGFVDPYTEYGLGHVDPLHPEWTARAPKYSATRVGGSAWNDAIHADREWIDEFTPDAEAAEVYLARGVTVVQSAKLDGIFRGRAFVASLAPGLPNDVVLEARSLHFASFDKGSARQVYPTSLMGSIALIRQSLLDADWYVRAREAFARNGDQPLPEFNSAIEALSANDGAILFESGDELSLLRAARISREFSLPFIHVGSNAEYARVEEIAALGQPIVLPLRFPDPPPVGSIESELDVTLGDLRHWERAAHNPATLDAHGVAFAFSGHGLAPEGDAFLKNVRKAVRRGLSPETALAALTVVPARLCGVDGEVGTLEPGKRADFFIADGNVIEEPATLYSVWIAGAPVHRKLSLDQFDFRGSYRLELAGKTFRLDLRGSLDAPTGNLEAGDRSTRLAGLDVDRTDLRFHADLSAIGAEGAVRFRIRGEDRLAGEAWLADGERVDVSVRKVADRAPRKKSSADDERDAEQEEREEAAALELISRLTFPNIAFGATEAPPSENVLIRNATIWTAGERGILEQADLLVRDGKIAAVGSGLAAEPGVRVLDATGKHVSPGIIDEHSHLAITRGVNEGSHSVTAEVRIGDVVNPDDIGIYRALAGGVTTAQLLHGSANPIGGQAQVIKMRWGSPAEGMKLPDAPPTIKFALGENVKQSNWGDHQTVRYPQSRMGVESTMRDAFTAAREYERAWSDFEALPPAQRERVVPPRRDLQLETLVEILNAERFVHCHSYMQAEILMLMRLAEEFGFRIQTFTHILEGYKVADEMAAHGATASTFADWWAYKFEVYDAIPYNTCLMHERGVVTSINSDSAELIRRLNHDAAKSVLYCGMSEAEAIKLATLNPAIQLRIDDRVGSLEVGKDADFVIWSGPPLSIYSRAEQTWVDGRNYFSLEQDAELRRADHAERLALTQKALRAIETAPPEYGSRKREKVWHCEDVDDVWNHTNR